MSGPKVQHPGGLSLAWCPSSDAVWRTRLGTLGGAVRRRSGPPAEPDACGLDAALDTTCRLDESRQKTDTGPGGDRVSGPTGEEVPMPEIVDVIAREVLDSRGNPTVEVDVFVDAGVSGNILYGRAARRHRSVGILKALGASMRDVFRLFFSEALLLGGFGALLGIGISVLLSKLMESTLGFEQISIGVLGAGILSAWAFTMALTVFPALQAARIPAAEAIRNE